MKLRRDNQDCIVVEATKDELYLLEKFLMKDVPGAEYSSLYRRGLWDGKARFYNTLKKSFPSGLLYMVQKEFDVEVDDCRSPGIPNVESTVFLPITLRDYQVEAVHKALTQGNGLWEMATNAGKTIAFVAVVNTLCPPLKGLILTHRVEIFNQIIDVLSQLTKLKVGKISSSEGCEFENCDVVVGMIPTVYSRLFTRVYTIQGPKERDAVEFEVSAFTPKQALKKAKKLCDGRLRIVKTRLKNEVVGKFLESVNVMILDEVHHATSDTWKKVIGRIPAVVRIGCSGTIPEEDTLDGWNIRALTGPVLIKVTNQQLIDREISAKPKVHMIEVVARVDDKQLRKEVWRDIFKNHKSKRAFSTLLFQRVQNEAIVHGKERNEVVCKVVGKHSDKSVLIVVDLLEHGRILKKLISEAEFMHGGESERKRMLEDFNVGKLRVLVSTSVIDEGIDISRIGVLVLSAGKKSRRQLLQRVGRGLRRKEDWNVLEIYDFADLGQNFLEKHTKERLKIWREQKFDVEHLEVKDL